MDLVTPAVGLFFWTVLIFLILLGLLKAFAWKPILNAVKERTESISEALKSAEKAKEEMVKLLANNESILKEARIERDKIIKEARDLKDKTIAEAKISAKHEADIIISSENQVATLSIEIAEKILLKQLSEKESQQALIEDLLKKTNIN